MLSNESFLGTVIERARFYMDEPDVDGKFTNDWLIRHGLMPALTESLARLNLNSENYVVLQYTFDLQDNVLTYVLPPCVQEVLQVVVLDSRGLVVKEFIPHDYLDVRGMVWHISGNHITFDPIVSSGTSITVRYISNGDVHPHYATDGALSIVDGVHRFQLSNAPSLGALDRRPGAYTGQILRIIPTDATKPVEERVIATSDFQDGDTGSGYFFVTPYVNFTYTKPGTSGVTYEIAPAASQALYEAVALGTAVRLATSRRASQAHLSNLNVRYQSAMKTIGDNLSNIQNRTGKSFTRALGISSDDSMWFLTGR